MLTDAVLREIAARASTLTERLSADSGFEPEAAEPEIASARLQRWRDLVARGDEAIFQRRLAWDGLEIKRLRGALGNVRLREGEPLPGWTRTFRAAIEAAASQLNRAITVDALPPGAAEITNPRNLVTPRSNPPPRSEPPGGASDPRREEGPTGAKFPFQELLTPFLDVARARLTARREAAYNLLTAEAHHALERRLLERLTELAAPTLELEFSIFRAARRSSLSRLLAQAMGSRSRDLYTAFVGSMLDAGLVGFFREYPVLARLLATAADLWVEAVAEFLLRLEVDQRAIAAAFHGGAAPFRVTGIGASISDAHNGGRSVISLTFASGLELVYKPKDLGLEQAYFDLLAWLNLNGAPLPFATLRVLNRGAYGWVEFAEHRPCASEEEAERYFRRSGMLLCLLYALGSDDIHFENVVASGEQPILVDLETLMHPKVAQDNESEPGAEAMIAAGRQLSDSVLGVGLLPSWMITPEGRSIDASGMGGVSEQESPYRGPRWEDINSDQMLLREDYGAILPLPNAATFGGVPISPADCVESIVSGFRALYTFLVENRGSLLAADGPLAPLSGQQVRFILRPTKLYARLLRSALSPAALQDGAVRSIELDILSRPHLDEPEPDALWALRCAEQQALERMDIPLFTAGADSDAPALPNGQRVERCFEGPCYNRALARLGDLGPADLARQLPLIRASFNLRGVLGSGPCAIEDKDAGHPALLRPLPVLGTAQAFIRHALEIAEELRTAAIRGGDGSAAWIGAAYNPRAGRFVLQPLGYDLYSGAPGVALFLAAAERVTAEGFKDLALTALRPLRREPRGHAARLAGEIGIGGGSGLGSVVYALALVGQLLNEPALIEDASRVAALITPERIAADTALDVISGAAGAALGLLSLHAIDQSADSLERAVICGQRLLQQRVPAGPEGRKTWRTLDGELITGFSLGAAGISYALCRLASATGEAEFREAAVEAFACERSIPRVETGDRPAPGSSAALDRPAFIASWCRGAPGNALARIGALPEIDSLPFREEFDAALDLTREYGTGRVDTLCCGSLGRAEVLLTASVRLGRPELLPTARELAGAALPRADTAGRFRFAVELPTDILNPGLFQGSAGMGYELLRLARPDLLPSLLLWE